MFFVKLSKISVAIVTVIIFLGQTSCETGNSNTLSCFEDDCQVSCETKGLTGGSCDGEVCECQSGESSSYQWTEDSSTEDDTESDGGSP